MPHTAHAVSKHTHNSAQHFTKGLWKYNHHVSTRTITATAATRRSRPRSKKNFVKSYHPEQTFTHICQHITKHVLRKMKSTGIERASTLLKIRRMSLYTCQCLGCSVIASLNHNY